MNTRRNAALAASLVLVLFTTSALAAAFPRGPWVRLGKTTVGDKVDSDTITVTARRGNFRAIQLHVLERDVEFREVVIRFANGDLQPVQLRNRIPAGGFSRVIDIEGYDRVIRAIELVYDAETAGTGKKAKVEVRGRH